MEAAAAAAPVEPKKPSNWGAKIIVLLVLIFLAYLYSNRDVFIAKINKGMDSASTHHPVKIDTVKMAPIVVSTVTIVSDTTKVSDTITIKKK